jgi:hypothetical protein
MSRAFHRNLVLIAASVSLAAACSAGSGGRTFTGGAGIGGETGDGGHGGGATTTGQGAGGSGFTITTNTGGGTPGNTCDHSPDQDGDNDGWTGAQGDCNDCDPNVNPGAVEVIATAGPDGGVPEPADEDCDGTIDNVEGPCDTSLAVDSMDPYDAAKAVELCKQTTAADKTWGVISARWALPDGTPAPANTNFHLGHGMLSGMGPNVNVQAGARMLGLSSGSARQPTDPGYNDVSGFDKGYGSGQPTGFPKESPSCSSGVTTGPAYDGAAVELQVRVPTNATGFKFDFNFFTYEWPGYVCSQYNDFFVAHLMPFPAGQSDGNISFDKQGNPVSVNNAFVDVCGCDFSGGPPCLAGGKTFPCSLGATGLLGTGFGQDTAFGQDHGSTGWLVTQAPATGGSTITLRWTVYDAGDGVLDSTTLIDNFTWIANGGTVAVGTDPIGQPK